MKTFRRKWNMLAMITRRKCCGNVRSTKAIAHYLFLYLKYNREINISISELRQRELDHERHKMEFESRVPRNFGVGGGFANGGGGRQGLALETQQVGALDQMESGSNDGAPTLGGGFPITNFGSNKIALP